MTTARHDQITDIVYLRGQGWTLARIGAEHGITGERVRQLLLRAPGRVVKPATPSPVQVRSARVHAWLRANGPATREEVAAAFDLSLVQVSRLDLPAHLVLVAPHRRDEMGDREALRAVHRAWRANRRRPLSGVDYDRLRSGESLTRPRLVQRFGTWRAVCEAAGVPCGRQMRRSYTREWDLGRCLEAVRGYVAWCEEEGRRPTYTGYEKWQKGRVAPSGTTVRNRVRLEVGTESWVDTVRLALAGVG